MKNVWIFLTILLIGVIPSILAWRTFLRGRSKHGLGAPLVTRDTNFPKEQWIQQNLDHFNPTDARTWEQRYFVNDTHWKKDGPVFLMIGGEGEASPKWMVDGQWLQYAHQYGALCFQVEHRFYGKSHPTQDLSVKNLVFLSSEQALADLAHFIETARVKYQIPAATKWIVFGGSYPGSLAAWARLKYPHLIHGAMSASGPLLAQIDFQQYYVVVENSLRGHSQACVDALAAANHQINLMLHHRIGQQGLTKKFNLCDPIESAYSKRDIANFYETLASEFAEIVQYNKDNRIGARAKSYTIDDVCNILVDEKRGIPVDRLAEISNMLLAASNEKCLDYKYTKMVDDLRNVTWASEMAEGGRQWMYQTCTEFGFFQTSTARPNLFSETFPVDFFVQQCTDVFGPRFNLHLLENSVERTNSFYGAKDIKVTNVVYVHGSIDPWHALGITQSTDPKAPAIFINGTAHCANMYPASSNDLPELTEARQKVNQLIGEWLKE
ncbi:putative serine protease K12H4.7 [Venturia canescens]|uniref:putative serine protease K12H4.7 n=1 Tax=Venturia canescens TaxID=32260 RepID=UPI001C9CE570|nr:putative serine protease K12H4.7 [Venturia canescens]XP_043285972.1 putative serine protease K12H4.7 [Venturia canescens]XP_043285973.1 putative serine protease K12H4.7 [Venturia canescens]